MNSLHSFVFLLIIIILVLTIVFVLDGIRRTKVHPTSSRRVPLVLSYVDSEVKIEDDKEVLVLYVQDEHRNDYIFKKLSNDLAWTHWPTGELAGEPWKLPFAIVNAALDRLYVFPPAVRVIAPEYQAIEERYDRFK